MNRLNSNSIKSLLRKSYQCALLVCFLAIIYSFCLTLIEFFSLHPSKQSFRLALVMFFDYEMIYLWLAFAITFPLALASCLLIPTSLVTSNNIAFINSLRKLLGMTQPLLSALHWGLIGGVSSWLVLQVIFFTVFVLIIGEHPEAGDYLRLPIDLVKDAFHCLRGLGAKSHCSLMTAFSLDFSLAFNIVVLLRFAWLQVRRLSQSS